MILIASASREAALISVLTVGTQSHKSHVARANEGSWGVDDVIGADSALVAIVCAIAGTFTKSAVILEACRPAVICDNAIPAQAKEAGAGEGAIGVDAVGAFMAGLMFNALAFVDVGACKDLQLRLVLVHDYPFVPCVAFAVERTRLIDAVHVFMEAMANINAFVHVQAPARRSRSRCIVV